MKLLSCEYKGETFAAVSDGKKAYKAAPDMYALLDRLEGALPGPELLAGEGIDLGELRLLAPIPEPRQDVICLGMNYMDHSAEAAKWGKDDFVKNAGKAVYFSKRAAYIVGPGGEIDPHFDIVDGLDYEAELAVVLGKDAYRVSKEDAFDYVLGYSVLNDVSARNLQKAHKQFYFGKSLDTHTTMGPWIVTRDELPGAPELDIRCFINGEKRQDSNTRYMIFGVAEVIAELSQGMTLKAGTIIAMGTPAGVGMGFEPPKYLSCGDVVRCEIDGIGVLENPVKN
uniref:fumarylacetoacetate hydrolase family protein n=1 Tax=Candidatus Scatomorpha intestinigallinarum TaxID=2840923 RepID=UPI0040265E2E